MRIFLVGNGPSLASVDLDGLIGHDTFAMNRIDLLYERFVWRPTFYMWSDLPQEEFHRQELLRHIRWGEEVWLRRDIYEQFLGLWRCFPEPWIDEMPDTVIPWDFCLEHVNAYPERCRGENLPERHPDWPDEWHFPEGKTRLCKLGNGMNPMMQCAIKKGYDELILLGCDLGWHVRESPEDANHFTPAYLSDPATEARARFLNRLGEEMHKLARAWCDRNGVSVVNATPGGELEVYPRVPLERLL